MKKTLTTMLAGAAILAGGLALRDATPKREKPVTAPWGSSYEPVTFDNLTKHPAVYDSEAADALGRNVSFSFYPGKRNDNVRMSHRVHEESRPGEKITYRWKELSTSLSKGDVHLHGELPLGMLDTYAGARIPSKEAIDNTGRKLSGLLSVAEKDPTAKITLYGHFRRTFNRNGEGDPKFSIHAMDIGDTKVTPKKMAPNSKYTLSFENW